MLISSCNEMSGSKSAVLVLFDYEVLTSLGFGSCGSVRRVSDWSWK
jgi:hypothetical protein